MSSVTNQFFKFQMLMVRCHVDEKKGVLELGELEYHKKWYFPNYFRNSVSDPIISKISANGPFCPMHTYHFVEDELRVRRSLLGPSLLKSLDVQSNAKELPIGLKMGL